MHAMVDRSRLTGSEAIVFNALFPAETRPEVFRLEAVQQNPLVEYSSDEKKAANYALGLFGFTSSKDRKYKGDEDMPELRIAYNGVSGAPLTHLNHLPFMAILEDTGQTDPRLPKKSGQKNGPSTKMTRKDHSKHMASMVVRDVMRMAIKTPDLFINRVAADMRRYTRLMDDPNHQAPDMEGDYYRTKIDQKVKAGYLQNLSETQVTAMATALEYAKYLALFAYLHDERTPAWGDIIMKAGQRFPGQTKVDYSEDETLARDIDAMTQDLDTGIPQYLEQFRMDREFFVAFARSLASENDSCLGGILMKSKRKNGFVEKGGPAELANLQSFDEDQVSGTVANMQDLAAKILPGGFRYMHKLRSDVPSSRARPLIQPIGSFHERLQILMYALSTNMTCDQLTSQCRRAGIPPERVFIAAEEFQIGPNFLLTETPTSTGEILPVSLDPGSLKRVMEAFAALTYFHYQSDQRSAVETFVQDIFTVIHDYQMVGASRSLQPINRGPLRTEILSLTLERSDYGLTQMFNETVPLLPYVVRELFPQADRLNEAELRAEVDRLQADGKNFLVSRATMRPLKEKNMKPGSLTVTAEGKLDGYLEVINRRLNRKTNQVEDHPHSLPNRLRLAAENLEGQDFYFLFELDSPRLDGLLKRIEMMPSPEYRNLIKRAIRYWTLDLALRDGTVLSNPLARNDRLRLLHEDPDLDLLDQQDANNADLLYLMSAQQEELKRLNG